MISWGLYLENVCINKEVILFEAQYFSVKSCAQPLLVATAGTFPWRQIPTHVFGAKFEVTPTY